MIRRTRSSTFVNERYSNHNIQVYLRNAYNCSEGMICSMMSTKSEYRPGQRIRKYWVIPTLVFMLLIAHIPYAVASTNQIGPIVADIASLPLAQGSSCQGVMSAVQGGGLAENYLNQDLGTDFPPVTVSSQECSILVSFIPIIGTYNGLIVAAQDYSPSDPTSVENFYEQVFLTAAEVVLVEFALDGVLYKASFSATAELNDGLKLGKLQSICGNSCYSDVLSSLYWFIKGTMSTALDGFLSWAAKYLPTKDLPPLPSQCSVPILGSVLRAFGWMGCKR
jgi:hypothetical protein